MRPSYRIASGPARLPGVPGLEHPRERDPRGVCGFLSSGTPRLGTDVWRVTLAQSTNWTRAQSVYGRRRGDSAMDVSSAVRSPGRYYLKDRRHRMERAGGPDRHDLGSTTSASGGRRRVRPGRPVCADPNPLYLHAGPPRVYLWSAARRRDPRVPRGPRPAGSPEAAERSGCVPTDADELRPGARPSPFMQTFLAVMFVNISVGLVAHPPPVVVQEILRVLPVQLVNAARLRGAPVPRDDDRACASRWGPSTLRRSRSRRGRLPPPPRRAVPSSGPCEPGRGRDEPEGASLPLLRRPCSLIVSSILFASPTRRIRGLEGPPDDLGARAMAYLFLRTAFHARSSST